MTVSNVSLKTVALPAQHGGWGFLAEPILLGLLIAPSSGALWLSLAALGAFLLHQPLKLAVKDLRKGKRYERTTWALRFALTYAALAALGFALALMSAGPGFLLPILYAVPLALAQLWYEFQNEGRSMAAEICGALAFGAIAPAAALMSGWGIVPAMALWLALAIRAATSILYVRARLRLEYGRPAQPQPVIYTHIAGLLVFVGLALADWLPWLPVLGGLVLLARAWLGLSDQRKPTPAKIIGFRELGYGLGFVALIVLGYALGW